MEAIFNRFSIMMTAAQATSCSHAGECIDDVRALLRVPAIQRQIAHLNVDDIKAELREYGAWSQEELEDEDANVERIMWVAACNIRDDLNQH